MRANRVWTRIWLALAGLLLAVPAAVAQSIPAKGSITVYGMAGGLDMSLGDVNQSLEANQDFLRQSFILANYKIFGLTGSLGGSIAYQLMDRVSVAVEYNRQQKGLRNNTYAGTRGQLVGFLENTHAKLQDITLNLSWYPPLDTGIFVGAGAGYGWSDMNESIGIVSEVNPDSDTHYRGEWTGSSLSAQGFVGYHFDFVAGTKVTFRGGYRYLNLGVPTGTTTETTINGTTESSTDQLPLGTVGWDFSGWNAVLSVGYSFFGG